MVVRWALIFALCIPMSSHGITGKREPSPAELLSWAEQRARTHEGLRSKLEELEKGYEIVFIPGILGSSLTIGNYHYGSDRIETDKLIFDEKQQVVPGTLNQFKAEIGFGRIISFAQKVDIYGSGLDLLKSGRSGKPALEFAYDWRDDIDRTATKFQEWAKDKVPHKRVIIVAHSMGGVVAWHWKNKYGRNEDRPFTLVALILLGSPIRGTCEVAHMLVEGYSAPEASASFDKWATHLVFDQSHPAIFTFPSVFQLLPKYDKNSPCVRMKTGNIYLPQNHHEEGLWLGRDGGSYRLGGTDGKRRNKFMRSTGLNEAEYLQRVRKAIEAGRRFRRDFDPSQNSDQVYFLYSDAYEMTQSYPVTVQDGWLSIERGKEGCVGDGRVPQESATNGDDIDYSHGGTWLLHEEHGKLLSDKDFPKFASRNIDGIIMTAKKMELLGFVLDDFELRKEVEDRGWGSFEASPPTNALVDVPAFAKAQRTIAAYNISQVTDPLSHNAGAMARAIALSTPFSEDGPLNAEQKAAAALIQSSLVIDPNTSNVDALERLGKIRAREGRNNEAVWALRSAISLVAARTPDVEIETDVGALSWTLQTKLMGRFKPVQELENTSFTLRSTADSDPAVEAEKSPSSVSSLYRELAKAYAAVGAQKLSKTALYTATMLEQPLHLTRRLAGGLPRNSIDASSSGKENYKADMRKPRNEPNIRIH